MQTLSTDTDEIAVRELIEAARREPVTLIANGNRAGRSDLTPAGFLDAIA
jgi:hypothetical protein